MEVFQKRHKTNKRGAGLSPLAIHTQHAKFVFGLKENWFQRQHHTSEERIERVCKDMDALLSRGHAWRGPYPTVSTIREPDSDEASGSTGRDCREFFE